MRISSRIIADIESEMEWAESKHPNYPSDPLRRVALICEEAGEALKTVLDLTRKYHTLSDTAILTSCLQVEVRQTAVMAIRLLQAMGEEP